MPATSLVKGPTGKLAFDFMGVRLPLQVLCSAGGHYLGTFDDEGPVSRESAEYWPTEAAAAKALAAGPDAWTQRDHP
jgi:hypothetical protein